MPADAPSSRALFTVSFSRDSAASNSLRPSAPRSFANESRRALSGSTPSGMTPGNRDRLSLALINRIWILVRSGKFSARPAASSARLTRSDRAIASSSDSSLAIAPRTCVSFGTGRLTMRVPSIVVRALSTADRTGATLTLLTSWCISGSSGGEDRRDARANSVRRPTATRPRSKTPSPIAIGLGCFLVRFISRINFIWMCPHSLRRTSAIENRRQSQRGLLPIGSRAVRKTRSYTEVGSSNHYKYNWAWSLRSDVSASVIRMQTILFQEECGGVGGQRRRGYGRRPRRWSDSGG